MENNIKYFKWIKSVIADAGFLKMVSFFEKKKRDDYEFLILVLCRNEPFLSPWYPSVLTDGATWR